MSGDTIRQRLKKQPFEPFEPFEVHMSSGAVYQVKHPEQPFVTGANLYIWYPDDPGDHVASLSLLHITGLEISEIRKKPKGGKS